jgi:protein-tyrosine phosphatase
MRRRGFVLVLVAVGGLLAGCSADGGGESAATTTTTTAPAAAGFTDVSVERGETDSLTISWELDGDGPVEVAWSPEPGAGDEVLETVDDGSTVTVDDPSPGVRAFFTLTAGDATATVAERRVPLEGAPNFRDLGGYETEDGRHVRWGQVYRSGALADLTDADLNTLDDTGINLVCDLRSDSEVEEEPDPEVGSAEALRLAVTDESTDVQAITDAILAGDLSGIGPELLEEGMPAIATEFPESWRTLLERLAEEGSRPTIVHCTAGKDRAGWASALTLRALGVPEETVMEDYLLSNEFLAESNAATLDQVRPIVAGAQGVPEGEVDLSNLEALLTVRPEYLQAAFDAVEEEYGDFETYLLEGIGLDQATLDALRDQLLE